MTEDLTKLPNRLYHVELPPQHVSAWQEKMDKDFGAYGKFFKSRDECDYFTMLPLNTEQRHKLLLVMKEERDFEQELSTCKGRPDANAVHRAKCISCVMKYPPHQLEKVCV
jgi:hypothetical protein